MVYPIVRNLKTHEAYMMLQDMVETEKKALVYVTKLEKNVIQMLETRRQEQTADLKLKVESLDWDRNHFIRELLQEKVVSCLLLYALNLENYLLFLER